MRTRRVNRVIAFLLISSLAVAASAQTKLAELTASDSALYDLFAISVAASSDTVVVGASGAIIDGKGSQGAAYVFVKPANGWTGMTQTAKLTASDGLTGDQLGLSVSISGDTIVAGAPNAGTGRKGARGAVYVFVKPASGWTDMTETAKLTAGDGLASDEFGSSVGVSGNTVAAGAPGVSGETGNAYVFVKPTSGWTTTPKYNAKLSASDAAENDQLGRAIAISGNTVVSGTPYKALGQEQGAAYVFVSPPGGWRSMTETAKLTASDAQQYDELGYGIAISGNTIALGAPQRANTGSGKAYVYVKPPSGWTTATETAELTAASASFGDAFGEFVSITGNTLLVGAPNSVIQGNPTEGAAYIFVKPVGGWTSTSSFNAEITDPNSQTNDAFGFSISQNGGAAAIGAPSVNNCGCQLGSAYVFLQ